MKKFLACVLSASMMLGLLAGCCRISPRDAAYYCIHAFVLAEFAASLEWQLYCFLLLNREASAWMRAGLLVAVYLAVFLLMGGLGRRTGGHLAGAERGCHHRCSGVRAE